MYKEITKGILAVLIVGGAIAAAIMGNANATGVLIPIAGFVVGYYFKQAEGPVSKRIKAMFKS